jgi:hypothetical protein
MNKSDSQVPARKVERDEIVAAINEICEKRGVPAVRISDLEELDHIEVGTQSISENLDDLEEMGKVNLLEYGQKGVWWVPDDVETSADVEAGVIDWDNIDANDIPHEVLADLPEFQDQTYWEGMVDSWGTVAGGGLFVFALSLFLIAVNQNTALGLSSTVSDVLSIVLVGAIGVVVISFGIVQLARFGQLLEDKGINGRIRNTYREAKHGAVRWIQQRLPDLEG